jgi:predicted RNase H-like HicB family nuclease
MFAEYLDKAMEKAEYELIEDGTYFGIIPGFDGLWGNGQTIEACRRDLVGALEGWLILKLWDHDDDIPVLGKLSLTPRRIRIRGAGESASSTRNRKAS